jgi:hypothetical protein
MTESEPERIVAIDAQVTKDWFLVSVVTPTTLIKASLKPNKHQPVLEALKAGADPTELLKKNSPLGHGPHFVPLSGLESLEWYTDQSWLIVRYVDPNKKKSRSVKVPLSNAEAQQRVIEAIHQIAGGLSTSRQQAGLWHISKPHLIVLAVTWFFCGLIAYIGSAGPVDADKLIGGKKRRIGRIANFLGPTGAVIVGLIVTVVVAIVWIRAWRNPPTKTTALVTRNP